MMTSVLVTNLASNKYILLSQGICAIYNNKYNYNKIRLQIIPNFRFLCE